MSTRYITGALVALARWLRGRRQSDADDVRSEMGGIVLADSNDPREVVSDEHARYFGSELSERSLVPLGEAILGKTRYSAWHGQARADPVSSSTT
jgi:hypothetical protein